MTPLHRPPAGRTPPSLLVLAETGLWGTLRSPVSPAFKGARQLLTAGVRRAAEDAGALCSRRVLIQPNMRVDFPYVSHGLFLK